MLEQGLVALKPALANIRSLCVAFMFTFVAAHESTRACTDIGSLCAGELDCADSWFQARCCAMCTGPFPARGNGTAPSVRSLLTPQQSSSGISGSASAPESLCFDRNDKQTCLPPGTHILFMGDSLIRYQYLALVYALHNSGIPLKAPPIGTDDARRYANVSNNIVDQHTWRDWLEFFEGTSEAFYPFELCNCYRAGGESFNPSARPAFENRYMYHPAFDVSVTYISVFGLAPLVGNFWPSAANTPDCRQPAGRTALTQENLAVRFDDSYTFAIMANLTSNRTLSRHFNRNDWQLSWVEVLRQLAFYLPPRPPTAVVLNSGHHHLFDDAEDSHLAQQLRAAAQQVSDCSLWQTTTPSREMFREARMFSEAVARSIFNNDIFDAAAVVRKAGLSEYLDPFHFTPGVYLALNRALLHQLHERDGCLGTQAQ